MDDSCAVCADTLEWVAYGPCGHRDVCSTCVARLRFICDDRRCCICKTESDAVFVTKALGDYTRVVSDFSVLPFEPREGRSASYWYHEDTQAYFDDVDHYKMIKAMCKLSCSECDKMEEQANDGQRRRARFRNIEQLKGHLFHKHKLFMCSLCLEGRKVFICEQKLYSKAQLNQHVHTGDSEVDGTESERGGFSGHPMCEFCRTPFYGDNELYTHMSTEHYTCHMCQRQNPGKYEYYKNYDDLEMHFRTSHFLCEDESCLAKKFIVFLSEAEMKRHNAVEHGGRMSRSKRNAALQIPTSFTYRQNSNEQVHQRGRGRGRGRGFRRDASDNQLSMAIQASLETAAGDGAYYNPSPHVPPDIEDLNDAVPIVQPFEALSMTESESSRYRQALGQGHRLEESAFPPLATAPESSHSKPQQDSDSLSMAAHLRRKSKQNKATVIISGNAWPAANRGRSSNSAQAWPVINAQPGPSWASSQNKPATSNQPGPSSYISSTQVRPTTDYGQLSSRGNPKRIAHSASAPNLAENGFSEPSISDFPPVSSLAQTRQLPKTEEVQTANKSLVEKIRAALEFDEEKYASFKTISGQYRQGTIDTGRYLNYVRHFNLLHLVIELARLCPDPLKQKELIETYNASVRSNADQGSSGSKKGKGKAVEIQGKKPKETEADNFLNTVRKLQSSQKASDEEVEVLSKDGYRGAKGKLKLTIEDQSQQPVKPVVSTELPATGGKQRKKMSKFNRVRLGDYDGSSSLSNQDSDPQPEADANFGGGLPVRGVWRKGGGNKLFS